MTESLKGKTALITGAGQRVGRETALALADEGVNIIVHYRSSEESARELAGELSDLGVKSWILQADFSRQGDAEGLIGRAIEVAGSLDILINNASEFPSNSLDDLTFDDLVAAIQVNAWVPFVLSREFARKVGRGKKINFLDTRLEGYDWTHAAYILSKHMLATLTTMTAVKYAPDITVNAVAPGLILPPAGKDVSYLEKLAESLPLKRHGDPQEVANAVVYLLKSQFITGEVIYIDGGRHLRRG